MAGGLGQPGRASPLDAELRLLNSRMQHFGLGGATEMSPASASSKGDVGAGSVEQGAPKPVQSTAWEEDEKRTESVARGVGIAEVQVSESSNYAKFSLAEWYV